MLAQHDMIQSKYQAEKRAMTASLPPPSNNNTPQ
jgi:hypothetical protein